MKGDGGREHRALLEPARVALRPELTPGRRARTARATLGPTQPRPRLRGLGSALREREDVRALPAAGRQRRGGTERAARSPQGDRGHLPARSRPALPPPSDARPLPVPSDPRASARPGRELACSPGSRWATSAVSAGGVGS